MASRWFSRGNRRARRKAPEPLDEPWTRHDEPCAAVADPTAVVTQKQAPSEDSTPKSSFLGSPERKEMSNDVLAPKPPAAQEAARSEDDSAKERARPPLVESVRESSLHSMASAKIAAYQQHTSSQNNDHTMIPIAPGVNARLRGADETWQCIERDFYLPVVCFACTLEMCCIQDADYVICPMCRVVSPLDGGHAASPHVSNDLREQREQTVGLGFTFEDLCKWQSEILSRRTSQTV